MKLLVSVRSEDHHQQVILDRTWRRDGHSAADLGQLILQLGTIESIVSDHTEI